MTPNPSIERTMTETFPSWRDSWAVGAGLEEARARNWTVLDMKKHCKGVFSFE